MGAQSVQPGYVAILDRAIRESALDAEGKHIIARHLHDVSRSPTEASRTQKLRERRIAIHLFGREHVDFPHEAGVPIWQKPFHPWIALKPAPFQNIKAQLPDRL